MANMRQIQNIAFQRMFQCQHDQTELIYILIKKEENREKEKEKKPKEDKPKKELMSSTLLAQKAAGYLLATANAAKREIAASKK